LIAARTKRVISERGGRGAAGCGVSVKWTERGRRAPA